jgi:hypothetical protein
VHVHRRQAVARLNGGNNAVVSVYDEAYTKEVAFLLVTNDHTEVVSPVIRANVEVLCGVRTSNSIAIPDQVPELVVDVWTGCRCLIVWGDEYVAVGEAILDGHVKCRCS